jgi:chromosomal replication initiation ATPase DnaA
MTTTLASLHRAHKERLKRLGGVPSAPVARQSIQKVSAPPQTRPEPSTQSFARMRILQTCVAQAFEVPQHKLTGPDRELEVVRARHAGMFLARDELGTPFREVGRRFGDRKHTTVMNGYRHAIALMLTNEMFREKIERARAEFRAITRSSVDQTPSPRD